MEIKNEVLYRVYFLLGLFVVPAALTLVYRTFQIGVIQQDKWKGMIREAKHIQEREIEAERGSIMANDGSLLATSVPIFDLFFDPQAPSDEDFNEHVDSLAYCLATYVDNSFTVGAMRDHLIKLRTDSTYNKSRNVPIKRKVLYAEKQRIEEFPLFNLGQFRGGLIARKRSERRRPFGLLARRTIGYIREEAKPIGLEGKFDQVLGGEPGKELTMFLVDPKHDLWKPQNNLTAIEPRNGDDVVTTIDINIQDIAEDALLRAMERHDAEWGTVVVMEVNTGAIKAIANIGRESDGWYESYNYAIGNATEPGSTFKLASMMAMLEDGYISLEDSVDIEHGKTTFYDEELEDSSPLSATMDTISVRQAFEMSSNVGMAKLVNEHYGNKGLESAAHFIDRLREFNLNLPTGIELDGEASPFIKDPNDKDSQWSGTTLPWMAIGYELQITPLQMLTLYNAVANNGREMKPYLVSSIQRYGETVRTFPPTVIKRRIASKETIRQVKSLLEGVVERGTAYKLKSDQYNFAGKTGTAQINYRRGIRGNLVGGYQASFAGYFPAENPVYSCVVVINKPRQGGYYGGDVAGPVFREIADQCFDALMELHPAINVGKKPPMAGWRLPNGSIGLKSDFFTIMKDLRIPFSGNPGTEMAVLQVAADTLSVQPRSVQANLMPNVVGMGLRDALYLCENSGITVKVNGFGKVIRQSLLPGTRANGQTVWLQLE
ncbi:MAG TPA: penicillin-binding protein [Flavilitoribacter sp.]|nr:penicillin-binding protein [Flavilitoribacter sp.]